MQGDVDPKSGISVDFGKVKELVYEHTLNEIDHNDLNQVLDNPTAENVVTWMWQRLEPAIPGLVELQLYETPDSGVIYRGTESSA